MSLYFSAVFQLTNTNPVSKKHPLTEKNEKRHMLTRELH